MRRLGAGLAKAARGLPKSLLRNLRWQYLANLGGGVLGGLYFLLLGRLLGIHDFGIYSLCVAFTTLIFNCFDLRLQEAVIRFMPGPGVVDPAAGVRLRILFILDFAAKLLAATVTVGLATWSAHRLVRIDAASDFVLLAALMLFLSRIGNSPATGVLRAVNRFDLHAWLLLADWGFRLVLTAALGAMGRTSIAKVLLIATATGGITNAISVVVALRSARIWTNAGTDQAGQSIQRLLEMRGFILASYGISICDNAVRELDTTIIGWFLGIEQVAIYRMTKNFVLLIWRAADPVFLVVMPEFRRLLECGELAAVWQLGRRLTLLLSAAALLLFAGGTVAAPFIVSVFLGPAFAGVGGLFPAMAAWILVSLPLIWTHALAAAAGRPALQLNANLLGNALAVLLFVAATPAFGLIGAAAGWSIGLGSTFILSFYFLRRARVAF